MTIMASIWCVTVTKTRSLHCRLYVDCQVVSWDDAQCFIKRLNEKTGKEYRGPVTFRNGMEICLFDRKKWQ